MSEQTSKMAMSHSHIDQSDPETWPMILVLKKYSLVMLSCCVAVSVAKALTYTSREQSHDREEHTQKPSWHCESHRISPAIGA